MPVITINQRLESTLKKKNNSICNHMRESVARSDSITTHIWTKHNYADLLTKVMFGTNCCKLVNGILYDRFDKKLQDQPDDILMILRGLMKYAYELDRAMPGHICLILSVRQLSHECTGPFISGMQA